MIEEDENAKESLENTGGAYIELKGVYGDEINEVQKVLRRNGYSVQISGKGSNGRSLKLLAWKTESDPKEVDE